MTLDISWFEEQVRAFDEAVPRYQQLAGVLQEILGCAAERLAPLAIVQARAKSVPSFCQKILRKREKYRDPVHQLTDLCGARVIVHTKADVDLVCRFIRKHFVVDEANSLDAAERLRATEFGYRSVHYVVELRPGQFPTPLVPVQVPEEVYGLKVEIQVRTIAQHAWADIGHDRLYKSLLKVPDRWQREAARIAALLENADEAFARLVGDIDSYRAHYDAYLTSEQMQEELDLLEAVRRHAPKDPRLALRIARLRIAQEQWQQAADFLEAFPGEKTAPLLACLGYALGPLHQQDRNSVGYRQGRERLQQAIDKAPDYVEAIATLARTWIGVDDRQALGWYERAYRIDPADPRVLAGYVTLKAALEQSLSAVAPLAPGLEAAIRSCRSHVADKINLPWALFYMGEMELLLRRPYRSLTAYCKAMAYTPREFMIESALQGADKLAALGPELPEAAWVQRLLLLARAVEFAKAADPRLGELASRPLPQIVPPVVIVVGGCDPSVQEQMETYRELLAAAFRDFRGTIISGGTREGVPGLVGDLCERYPGQFRTLAYVPESLPPDANLDTRYGEIRRMAGSAFTAEQPLQNWIDLVAAGIRPADVKVLGINGGEISALEYRLALALGAKVGVLRESGREAGRLIGEAQWDAVEGLAQLCADPMTLHTFVHYADRGTLEPQQRETIARAVHEEFRQNQRNRFKRADPAMEDWESLLPSLRASNYAQAEHIGRKLEAVGKRAVRVTGRPVVLYQFTPQEVEQLAEMEHARWNVERLLDGWTPGERDPARKRSPYLVSWADLPDSVREWDRQAVRAIPKQLQAIGMEIQAL